MPRQFLQVVVLPNVLDFHQNYGELRYAYNAIAAVDALAAHLYVWATVNAPTTVATSSDDTAYRATLAARDHNFALLRDIAKALKHVRLTRGSPSVTHASQVTSRPIGYGEGGFGAGRYGGPSQVVVDTASGAFSYVEAVVDDALEFLKEEMDLLGA
jgi:hypothetical protein